MFTIASVFFVSFPVRLTELCVGDRKALQEPFVWITSRMVSCAGEDTIIFLFEIPTRGSEHVFFFHKKVICSIDVVTEETNETTAAIVTQPFNGSKKRHNMVNSRSFKPI